MWIILGLIFFVGWLLLKVVWHVASFGVHFLLLAAIVAAVIHFVRGRTGHRDSPAGV